MPRDLRPLDDRILSALDTDDESAHYDRHAAVYDRVIGSALYNRLLWRTRVADYAAFTAEALSAGTGSFLDAGCGTTVFTADAYRATDRALTLVDRSAGMLRRAATRVGSDVRLVQADIYDLPFDAGGFDTVGCFAMLHVLDDPWPALAGLRAQLRPGGTAFVSMFVTGGGGVTGPYMRALQRRGELGPPRSLEELTDAARDAFGDGARVERRGAMAYVRATI